MERKEFFAVMLIEALINASRLLKENQNNKCEIKKVILDLWRDGHITEYSAQHLINYGKLNNA